MHSIDLDFQNNQQLVGDVYVGEPNEKFQVKIDL